MIILYKNCLITLKDNLYVWGGKGFVSLYLAKKSVDLSFKHLDKSIAK